MQLYIKQLQRCIAAGVPLIAINTPDYGDSVADIVSEFSKGLGDITAFNILRWDTHRGVIGLTEESTEAASSINGGEEPGVATSDPQEVFERAPKLLPDNTILIMDDVHLLIESRDDEVKIGTIQGIRNARDEFKRNKRFLILLTPGIKLPLELVNDFKIITAPFPDAEVLKPKVEYVYTSSGLTIPGEEEIKKSLAATLGLSRFAAENSLATSIRKGGMSYQDLWDDKKSYIRQIGGLSVPDQTSSFASLGGLEGIIRKGQKIINGKRKPVLVVLLDEIDKWIVSLGDSNGINADALGQLLSAFQDYDWDGIVLPGFAGTGKTEWAKAMGNEAGGLFIQMDLGGTKGGIVGDSERMIRAAIGMLKAMSQGMPVFFVATCNNMSILQTKPELLRRLSYGIHFFDLPTPGEQVPIWNIYIEKFNLPKQEIPMIEGFTGAEIKKACKLADEFGEPLSETVNGITPVFRTMGPDGVKNLRKQASDGWWLSATTGEPYKAPVSKTLNVEQTKAFINKKGSN